VPDRVDALADALIGLLQDPSRRADIGRTNRAEAVARYEFGQQVAAMRAAFDRH
jgi:hypothetical protein